MTLRPAGEEGGHDVVAVPVEVVPGPVVMRRRHVGGCPVGLGVTAYLKARNITPPETGSEVHQYDGTECAP